MTETRKITATISVQNFDHIQKIKAELQKQSTENISFSTTVDRILDSDVANCKTIEDTIRRNKA